ncbi:MAG: flippase-like domain-containing protein [Candidatus Aenigmarchaeota archaeon]|nr:flippase-like domain-containing protein [Candidatus Aenigmarchaeota archaeon]
MKISRLLPLIGLAIFAYLLASIDLSLVAASFVQLDPLFFLAALALSAFVIVLKAVKWQVIIRSYGLHFSFLDALKGWLVGFAIGLVTPGKIGDLARSYYLKEKANIGKSITTVVVDRIADIFVLFLLAIVGLSVFVSRYVRDDLLLFATYGLFFVFVGCVALFSRKRVVTALLRPLFNAFVSDSRKGVLKGVYDDFYAGIDVMLGKKAILLASLGVTFLIWAVTILYAYVLAIAMGLQIPYDFLFFTFPVVGLLFALPISFSGLGTREASLVFFLSYLGIPAETAIAYSLMMLVVDYILGAVGFGLWTRHPIRLRSLAGQAG